jgi:hypothetical protein
VTTEDEFCIKYVRYGKNCLAGRLKEGCVNDSGHLLLRPRILVFCVTSFCLLPKPPSPDVFQIAPSFLIGFTFRSKHLFIG